jgi:hypothetical protein
MFCTNDRHLQRELRSLECWDSNTEYVADCNTGRCYSETYDALIEDPEHKILLPLLLASDGTALG